MEPANIEPTKVTDLALLTLQTCQLSRRVRTFIMQEFQRFDRQHIEYKGLNDMVSYVDKQAEQQLVAGLKDLLPSAGFIAEEGTGKPQEKGYNWVIDPLDGTTNFVHGIPIFAISLALVKDGVPLLGVVHELNHDELYHAYSGGGAFMNGQSISVSPTKQLKSGLIATGFPYTNFEKKDQYMRLLVDMMEKSHGLRRLGSAAVDLVYVAIGRTEGFFEYGLNPWDVAGGAIIVQEAGGIVTDFGGKNDYIFGREILAANTAVHTEILELAAKHFS